MHHLALAFSPPHTHPSIILLIHALSSTRDTPLFWVWIFFCFCFRFFFICLLFFSYVVSSNSLYGLDVFYWWHPFFFFFPYIIENKSIKLHKKKIINRVGPLWFKINKSTIMKWTTMFFYNVAPKIGYLGIWRAGTHERITSIIFILRWFLGHPLNRVWPLLKSFVSYQIGNGQLVFSPFFLPGPSRHSCHHAHITPFFLWTLIEICCFCDQYDWPLLLNMA